MKADNKLCDGIHFIHSIGLSSYQFSIGLCDEGHPKLTNNKRLSTRLVPTNYFLQLDCTIPSELLLKDQVYCALKHLTLTLIAYRHHNSVRLTGLKTGKISTLITDYIPKYSVSNQHTRNLVNFHGIKSSKRRLCFHFSHQSTRYQTTHCPAQSLSISPYICVRIIRNHLCQCNCKVMPSTRIIRNQPYSMLIFVHMILEQGSSHN